MGRDFVEKPKIGTLPLPVRDELAAMRAGVVALARGADLLIYDTQFTPEEYKVRPHWGHSRPADAIDIAREAKVKQLCLLPHAPQRRDDDNARILDLERARASAGTLPGVSAYEGL